MFLEHLVEFFLELLGTAFTYTFNTRAKHGIAHMDSQGLSALMRVGDLEENVQV